MDSTCSQSVFANAVLATLDLCPVVRGQTVQSEHHCVDWRLSPVLETFQQAVERLRLVAATTRSSGDNLSLIHI